MVDPSKRPRANSLPWCAYPGHSQVPPNAQVDRQRLAVRVRITYLDDTVCSNSLANLHQLLLAAKHEGKATSNSAWMAKKALRYRKLLERTQAADVDDPAFNVAEFMGLSWIKRE